jgi:hypothetical protein
MFLKAGNYIHMYKASQRHCALRYSYQSDNWRAPQTEIPMSRNMKSGGPSHRDSSSLWQEALVAVYCQLVTYLWCFPHLHHHRCIRPPDSRRQRLFSCEHEAPIRCLGRLHCQLVKAGVPGWEERSGSWQLPMITSDPIQKRVHGNRFDTAIPQV